MYISTFRGDRDLRRESGERRRDFRDDGDLCRRLLGEEERERRPFEGDGD